MTEQVKRKATRKIKKFDFSDENATVSLVGPLVGGPAVGYTTLLTKSNKQVSEEFIKKASQITVTMSINEYLQRFFGIWCSADQELLARSLGFTTEGMDKAVVEQQEEMLDANEPPEMPNCWESEPGDTEYEKWINYKLQSIQVMKQLYQSEDINKSLVDVSEDDYLQLLKDQEMLEKVFVEIEKAKNSTANAGDASTNASVEKSNGVSTPVVNKTKKGNKSMTKEVQTQVVEQQVEVIAKAQFDEIQKAFSEQQVELQKALDLVKQFEAEKKEAIAKSRKESLVKACGDKAEVIFKACGDAPEEDFVAVVKALSDMQAVIEKSGLFQEQGASVEGEQIQESSVAALIKAKYSQKQ